MAIVASDIVFRLSTVSGSAGDSTASTGNASLGKYASSSVLPDATLHALFDVISGDENAASVVDYRCIFVLNNHATLTLQNAVVWVESQVAGGASVDISLDTTAASAKGSATAQAKSIANELTAPAAQTFAGTATSKATGLSIGNLAPGQVKGIWIKRSAANSAALNADGASLRVEGDSAA